MSEMIDAQVALTTSEYAFVTEDGDKGAEIELIVQNIPIIVVETPMNLPVITKDLMRTIHLSLTTGIEEVIINSNLRSVFIGADPNVEETGLVIYQDFSDTPCIDAFFKRWDEIHTLIFEYTLVQKHDLLNIIACVRGIRRGNMWAKLEIIDKPMLHVRDEK